MKVFIAALATVAMVTPAVSQSLLWNPLLGPLPETLPWSVKGVPVGTATIAAAGERMYLRLSDGTFIATVVFKSDGTRTIYDVDGKILDQIVIDHVVRK